MPSSRRPVSVAALGECMLELQGEAFAGMRQSFGGDTLNTAVYLARCGGAGLNVHYATGLGDDGLSAGLLQRWAAEGVQTGLVQRLPGRLPGLYMIELDDRGERRFHYWRGQAAARAYFDAATTALEECADTLDALYLSGISLAILPDAGRERVITLMARMRERGALVAFDNNYRPRLWAGAAEARHWYERALAASSLALITADDHQALHGLASLDDAVADAQALPVVEIAIKRGALPTRVGLGGAWRDVATEAVPRIVDTTAAGDSFAAGYLSQRLRGAAPVEAAAFGNRLAARVIQYPGALIPREEMRDLIAD
ncbi:sugar kinase [Roseateles saccharophilus]|uniref:2-dehydro-3-deoxygluconokinase n=1 Tax=Roseateles saccharophilus TaxID=304 RepID=A0A4R3VJP4_ROSSA|nr:sugar kinase [Roseateles saccharophilus]MDG0835453.1 sugar kinase [Roseateles saccharophilus]TCV04019.1 2-keto-3-deoxygluconate kinase [Roseateles saccharophilus]